MPSSPVYSVPFVEYTPSTPNNTYAVPDGYTAVVRQVSVVQNIGAFIATLIIQNSEAAPGVAVWQGAQVGDANYVGSEGRWVVLGGGIITLEVNALGSDVGMYAGGYLLPNTYIR